MFTCGARVLMSAHVVKDVSVNRIEPPREQQRQIIPVFTTSLFSEE